MKLSIPNILIYPLLFVLFSSFTFIPFLIEHTPDKTGALMLGVVDTWIGLLFAYFMTKYDKKQ